MKKLLLSFFMCVSLIQVFGESKILSTKDGGVVKTDKCTLVGGVGMYDKYVYLAQIDTVKFLVLSFGQPLAYEWEEGAPLVFKMEDSTFVTLHNAQKWEKTESIYSNQYIGYQLFEEHRIELFYYLSPENEQIFCTKNPVRFRVFNKVGETVFLYDRPLSWPTKLKRKETVLKDFKWWTQTNLKKLEDLAGKAKSKTIFDGM